MKAFRSSENFSSPRPYSPVVVIDEWLFASGHVPFDGQGLPAGPDVGEQTSLVLENLERTLAAAGSSRRDIVSTTVYLTDMRDINAMDREYSLFFEGLVFPSRTTVQVCALGRAEFKIEISAVARRGAA
jgi:2-iminobutanoate/2-iminopropanoate deaminase